MRARPIARTPVETTTSAPSPIGTGLEDGREQTICSDGPYRRTMGRLRWVQMSDEEMDAFLGEGGTGVISFSKEGDGPPFSIPVSYGYDGSTGQFYYRLSLLPGGEKSDLLDEPVTFVVHAHTDEGWRSVVASGRLEGVADSPYESAAVQGMWAVRIPKIDVFDRPPEDVTFRTFRLVPDRLTGRKDVRS